MTYKINKVLAKQVKKLIFSNRFTIEMISQLLGEPVSNCVEAFESFYKTPIPPSLLIIGNEKGRGLLRENVKNSVNTF